MHYPSASHRLTRALLIACYLLISAFAVPATLLAAEASFQVNDRIESNLSVFGWQPGVVKEIGSGDRAGQLRILTDGNANDNWVSAPAQKFIRKLAGPAPVTSQSADGSQAPRLGKYLIMSYGAGPNPLHLGYFELLAGGSYHSTDMGGNATGDGRYGYDGKAKEVRWMSGPFLTNKWGGKLEITRAGKTHNIQFKRGTFGTNSTD